MLLALLSIQFHRITYCQSGSFKDVSVQETGHYFSWLAAYLARRRAYWFIRFWFFVKVLTHDQRHKTPLKFLEEKTSEFGYEIKQGYVDATYYKQSLSYELSLLVGKWMTSIAIRNLIIVCAHLSFNILGLSVRCRSYKRIFIRS